MDTQFLVSLAIILATFALYIWIAIINTAKQTSDFYVAGRGVPPIFNGMAIGADWMSAASFIGMAGTIMLIRLRWTSLYYGLDRWLFILNDFTCTTIT